MAPTKGHRSTRPNRCRDEIGAFQSRESDPCR